MTDHDLRTDAGRRAADGELAGLLRGGRFADAESRLGAALGTHPGPIASACLAAPTDGVEVLGWDRLDAELTWLTGRGHRVTAVGLNLSNYHDTDRDDWWDKEPAIEVTPYTDDRFPFSTSSVEEVLAACESYPAPWTGGGLGEESVYPEVSGLRGVNGALLRQQDGDTATYLGWWWLHLRYRQAVVRHLDGYGLALTVPVLAGSHDVGPWLVTVHPVAFVSDHLATTTAILEDRRRRNAERYDAVTRETVAELRSLRENGRTGWGLRNRDKRRTYVELADARLALACRAAGLAAPARSIAKLGDAEFDAIVAAFVASRGDGWEQAGPT